MRTVKYQGCMNFDLKTAELRSKENRLLTYREFKPDDPSNPAHNGRILFISGIHGDEYTAISITYLWMQAMLKHQYRSSQHWLFMPLANPDGLLGKNPATRMNANGVDLNRNFPSPDWDRWALKYWKHRYAKNPRRYPGPSAASENETKWMVEVIKKFRPDAIISVHAPYGLLDYDGPEYATPNKIGILKHRELGTFPGSLGRYAGEYLEIPVLTLELRAANSMPGEAEIVQMWQDIENWVQKQMPTLRARRSPEGTTALNAKPDQANSPQP
ncbi:MULTISPECIES: M14 family zinc carboxypeptidase [Thiomicrorhabdus]|uniref:M14 family zinc carboxypeptidase n=1 Tax=Thiomicrorhabdus TaxID=2039723 RepID=UPI001E3AF281|nr:MULTISPECIES: M14 family zinc carboxypeptidase [Thiomicrorhabdus]